MPTLASKLGIRLVMLLGKGVPKPAPAAVMTAMNHVEVTNNMDGEDGFQLVFTLTKGKAGEFDIVGSGLVDPDTRAVVGVLIGATPHPLIDGIIYDQQVTPAPNADGFTLTVMGRSIQVLLDLEERDRSFPGQSASSIVQQILSSYQSQGIICMGGISTTSDTSSDKERIPQQQGTDLAYIRELAKRNSFIFYLEPKTLGTTTAYWGAADKKAGNSLPPLCTNLGPVSNVSELNFRQNSLAGLRVQANVIDPLSKQSQKIPPPPESPGFSLARPVSARRTVRLRCAGRLGAAGARDAVAARVAGAPDPVTAEGVLDTVRYGDVLRTRRIVTVCGAGRSYDGDYLIRKVTHEIELSKYTQRFTLSRKGLQASS